MKSFLKVVFGSCLGVILASVVIFFILFASIGAAVGGFMSKISKDKELKPLTSESVLMLDLTGTVTDTKVTDPFKAFRASDKTKYTLPEILMALEVARVNPNIEAVVLKLEYGSLNFATAKEIRDALLQVKEVGKSIYAFSDHYSFLNYYVSSVADKVMSTPEGSINISGITSTSLFTKGLQKKLGIEMQVFKVGTFKGAVEPYILDGLSDANRVQIQEYIDGLWQGTTSEMALSRGVDPSLFQTFADEALFLDTTTEAQKLGLLDTLIYRIDLDEVVASLLFDDTDIDVNYLRVADLLPKYQEGKLGSDNQIAVLYAEGNIVVGTGDDDDNPFADTTAHINEQLVEDLRAAAENSNIKAVVLRVNSGGGAATTSELICHELTQLKAKKPVVISMGDYAASGGYYISSNASAIVASPYTLTGSIGIFGMVPNFEGSMQKLGLKEEKVTTSATGTFSATKPINPRLGAKLQQTIERGYDQFITRVADGRAITKEQVDSIGQGRVWLGNKAVELGLVDQLGGLNTAINEAARLAEVDDYTVVEVANKKDWLKDLLGINFGAALKYMSLTTEERLYQRTQNYLEQMSGVKAMPPHDITMVGAAASETVPAAMSM